MYDKSYTFKTANDVLKAVIIPNLTDGIAKEQAIALVSVLKNLETNTVENIKPKEQILILIKQTLKEYVQKIRSDFKNFSADGWGVQIEEAINEVEIIENVTEKWKQLNELQCQLLRFLYKERLNNSTIEQLYINPLRKKIREQLNLEMELVR
jgi:hypothetical protein